MVEQARARFPDGHYEVGDLRRLMRPTDAEGWAAVLAWYSLIHLAPSELPAAVEALVRPLAPGGWLVVGLHCGQSVRTNHSWFETDIDLDFVFNEPSEVVRLVEQAGLVDVEWYRRGPVAARGETTERLYVLARRPTGRASSRRCSRREGDLRRGVARGAARGVDVVAQRERDRHPAPAGDRGLAEQPHLGVGVGQRGVDAGERGRDVTRPRRAPRTTRPAPRARIAGIGRPRIARACSANSERSCETRVTSPVSCGRGRHLGEDTSSPRTNSSTPNSPRPAAAELAHDGLGRSACAAAQDARRPSAAAARTRGSRRRPGCGRSARRTR